MTVVTTSYDWKNIVDPYQEKLEQPNGYDFTVDGISAMKGRGELSIDGKTLPRYEAKRAYGGRFFLNEGVYFLNFQEVVTIPLDAMGYMRPRSSLLRMGATLHTAVWDAGYQGKSGTLLVVYNPSGIVVERGAAIGQMVLHLTESTTRGYAGQYQHEGIEPHADLATVYLAPPGGAISPADVREALAFQEASR